MLSSYSSSHSMAELSGAVGPIPTVYVTCTEKGKVMLEVRIGLSSLYRLAPNGYTSYTMVVFDQETTDSHAFDEGIDSDWDVCKQWAGAGSENHAKIDKLKKAYDLCDQGMIDRAISLCPDICARAYYLKFAQQYMKNMQAGSPDVFPWKELKKAIAAGRAFAALIRTDTFCKGNLYNFIPTRFFVRSLFMMGAYSLYEGKLDQADCYLKEVLAVDIHDKFGARHKQLLVQLERQQGPSSSMKDNEQLNCLLKAKFGDDQLEDTILSLWNYTRALNAYCQKGDCKQSKKLLTHAISKNPHVPPTLLAWEMPVIDQTLKLMQLGSKYEAADYARDNTTHWLNCPGALTWLEKVYCETCNASPLTNNDQERQLFVEGTRLANTTGDTKTFRDNRFAAIDRFTKLLELLDGTNQHDQRSLLRSKCLYRKGLCHKMLEEYDTALPHFNSALFFCGLSDQDTIKELFYQRASCKESLGDYHGALEDYKFVFQRIGPFSVAAEGIQKMEARLNILPSASVLPPRPDIGISENQEQVRNMIRTFEHSMPPLDPSKSVGATVKRCGHCQRGGIKLAKCSGCSEAQFCSKECLTTSWKELHKYVCKGSKHRLEAGDQAVIQGLENVRQHNGQTATIVSFLKDKGRFCVQLENKDSDGQQVQVSLKPKNLRKKG